METFHVALEPPLSGGLVPLGSWRYATDFEDAKRKIWSKYPDALIDDSWQLMSDPSSGQRVEMLSAWGALDSAQEGRFVAYIRRMIV